MSRPKRAWLVPIQAPEGFRDLVLRVPAGVEWEAPVRGALVLLILAYNWEQVGTRTPEETVEVYLEAIDWTLDNWEIDA
jgi:hypothetical protein